MVHSVELVFDPDTEAAVRHIWDELRDAGIPSQAPASRPHATLTVAERIDPEVDELLASLAGRFPMPCRIGAPLFFGRAKAVLARLVVPTTALLDVHAQVHRLCLPHLHPGPDAQRAAGSVDRARDDGAARRARPDGPCGADRGEAAGDQGRHRGVAPLGRQLQERVPDRLTSVRRNEVSVVPLMFAASDRRMLASMSGPDPRADTLNWSDLGLSELPTGTVTLLLADVEGSTRLWESEPDQMADAVARLDRALADLVASHNGVRPVEQGEGDSFVVAFARATDAVACALKLQQAPLAPIRLRIGLHTGEVRLRDEGNYIGPTINRTARLRDLAHGGQTVLSGVTEELMFDQLPEGAWLTDLGTHELRDVARPERVAQLCHPDLRNEFPPLRVAKATAPQRLPAQFTSFVGREAEMAEVRQLLDRAPPCHADR